MDWVRRPRPAVILPKSSANYTAIMAYALGSAGCSGLPCWRRSPLGLRRDDGRLSGESAALPQSPGIAPNPPLFGPLVARWRSGETLMFVQDSDPQSRSPAPRVKRAISH